MTRFELKNALVALLISSVAAGVFCTPQSAADQSKSEDQKHGKGESKTEPAVASTGLFKDITTLVDEYYPHTKVTQKNLILQFEKNVHSRPTAVTARLQRVPDLGGILLSLEQKPGKYTGMEKVPQIQNEALHSTLLMAPYSNRHDCHVFVRLEYAPDVAPDFLQKFKALVNDFGDPYAQPNANPGGDRSVNSAPAAPVSSAPATSAVPAQTAAAASNSLPVSTTSTAALTASSPPVTKEPAKEIISATATNSSVVSSLATGSATAGQRSGSVSSTSSPSSTFSTPSPTSSTAPKKIFMWKATRGKDTVYLIGTIHGAKADFYPLPTPMERALEDSKHLLLEILIDKPTSEQTLKVIKQHTQYTSPDHLSLHISDETRQLLSEYLSWAGEPMSLYEKYKPWYVAHMVSRGRKWIGEKFKGSLGIDLYLMGRARQLKKTVDELESEESHFAMAQHWTDEVQDKDLQRTIRGLSGSRESVSDIVNSWKEADPEKFEKVLGLKNPKRSVEMIMYDKVMLDDRNIEMSKSLEKYMKGKTGPYLVAVGSAHMVGPTGLPTLLRKNGFQVQQSTYAPPAPAPIQTGVKKRPFPKEKMALWLPAAPEESTGAVHNGRYVQYQVGEIPDGCFVVRYYTPDKDVSTWDIPGPLALDRLADKYTVKATISKRKAMDLAGYAGRDIEYNRDKPGPGLMKGVASSEGGKMRIYLANGHFYILIADGKKQWLKSSNVDRFLNSLEITSER